MSLADHEAPVAAITTGLDQLRRSLRTGPRLAAPYEGREPRWSPRYLASPQSPALVASMADFGYQADDMHGDAWHQDDLALAGPVRLLNEEGTQHLRAICKALKPCAVQNDYVVSHRLRGVERISPFIHSLVRDPGFLSAVSILVGVPLVPHPIRDAAVQINYYDPPGADTRPDVAKWHQDGMNYVFTMTLSDHSEHEGGDYLYYKGHPKVFDTRKPEMLARGADHPDVAAAPFSRAGDTMFTRGSRIYHAVTPVTAGHRITLAISLFCPLFGLQDENRFWHSAPDDGLLRTTGNWLAMYRAILSPAAYCRRENIPLVPVPPQREAVRRFQ